MQKLLKPFFSSRLSSLSITFTISFTSTNSTRTAFVDAIRSIRKTRLTKKQSKTLFSILQPCTKTLQRSRFFQRGPEEKRIRSKKTTRATRNWVHLLHALSLSRATAVKTKTKFREPLKWIKATRIARRLIRLVRAQLRRTANNLRHIITCESFNKSPFAFT